MSWNNKWHKFILIGLILGFLLGSLSSLVISDFLRERGKLKLDQAQNKIEEVYQLYLGEKPNIEKKKELKNFYKFSISLNQSNGTEKIYDTLFLTKDGKYLVEDPLARKNYIESLKTRSEFIQCLKNNELVIYGKNKTPEVQYQINILKGSLHTSQIDKIYKEMDKRIKRRLLSRNITRIPAYKVNDKYYSGIKQINWFEEMTGCRLNQTS